MRALVGADLDRRPGPEHGDVLLRRSEKFTYTGSIDWSGTIGSPPVRVLPEVHLADAEHAREQRADRLAIDGSRECADAGFRLLCGGAELVVLGLGDGAGGQQLLTRSRLS